MIHASFNVTNPWNCCSEVAIDALCRSRQLNDFFILFLTPFILWKRSHEVLPLVLSGPFDPHSHRHHLRPGVLPIRIRSRSFWRSHYQFQLLGYYQPSRTRALGHNRFYLQPWMFVRLCAQLHMGRETWSTDGYHERDGLHHDWCRDSSILLWRTAAYVWTFHYW